MAEKFPTFINSELKHSEKSERMENAVERALNNLISEDEFRLNNERPTRDYKSEEMWAHIVVDSAEDFEMVLNITKNYCPWITDDWVRDTVEHEKEHVDEANKVFSGDDLEVKYGILFIQMDNGNIGIQPRYSFDVNSRAPLEWRIGLVRKAPTKKSVSDLKHLGQDVDNLDETQWH